MPVLRKDVPLLDFRAQHVPLRDEVLSAVTRVIDSQRFILGEEVVALERELAEYCGAKWAVGCGSGSDALLLALMACDVGPGDRVITTPFTFFATAGAIVRLQAIPVFVDIEEHTFNIDPDLLRRELARQPRVKAIVPVHLYGGVADMEPILAVAQQYGCKVIEDAAQAIGAEYHGVRAGSIGDFGCFSFYPTKNLGGYGEGGLVTTNSEAAAARIAALRVHGSRRRYYHEEVGFNSRLDALQAAVLRVKLRHLESWVTARQLNASAYSHLLAGIDSVRPPAAAPWQSRHVWNQYVIRCQRRNELQTHLKEYGVGTEVYYPLSLHQQPCFANLGYGAGDFPVSEQAAESVLAIPVSPELPPEDLEYVASTIRAFYA